MSNPPVLHVTVNGEKKEYEIRHKAAKRDKFYHSQGLNCVLVTYNNVVLAYEIYSSDEVSATSKNNEILQEKLLNGTIPSDGWYFDGLKFYRLDADPQSSFLGYSEVSCIDPVHITYTSTLDVISNDAFVITHDGSIIIQTPPIQGSLHTKNVNFKLIDNEQDHMFLNISMLLKICHVVSQLYGSEEIEKFDIPQYMIRHKTVNLAKLPPYVKDNSSSYLKPCDAISYILGLMHKETNSDNISKLTKLLRLICRNGVINIHASEKENVYLKEVPLLQNITQR
jgi:hypothetical protein